MLKILDVLCYTDAHGRNVKKVSYELNGVRRAYTIIKRGVK